MKTYIGTKIVKAESMDNINGDPGYRVIYEDGYESWSPEKTFERAYRQITLEEVALVVKA